MPAPIATPKAPAVAPANARAGAGGNAADKFMAEAKKFVGKPYLWGGGHGAQTGANQNVDCSGLVLQAYRMAGLGNGLDGTAQTQYEKTTPVPLDEASLKPGDLVFRKDGSEMGHVGIYIGDGKVLHAGDPVQIQQGLGGFTHAGRIFDEGGQPLDTSGTTVKPGGAAAPGGARDTSNVNGGNRASGLSLPPSGGAASNAASGGAASGGAAAAPAGGTPTAASGAPVPTGDFGALIQKLEGMGVTMDYLKALSEKYGVPVEAILAVIMQESGGDPNAGSPAGAQGLMQLMPGTAAGLGVTNPLDPKQNVEGGVKYLAQMMANPRAGGDWAKAFAMYNAGPAGNFDNPETQTYIRNVPALMNKAKAAMGG